MIDRTTSTRVTFSRPFRIRGMDRDYSAGTYLVESDEELLGNGMAVVYRRTSTRIHLTSPGRLEVVQIELQDLDTALVADATDG